MGSCTERPTDPPEFEDEIFPEIDHDAERKAEIESRLTEDILDEIHRIANLPGKWS